ncbi:LOW QUALITY PROTEIN: WRC domain [Dillenia turbinata]|uniref:Growth-regulating factor n=1 Tax=Dillenia turbinata TaxID=194707 RepID=A0AAN8UTB6_9MAGN
MTILADPEPGRCRRTDGKKWRCSKEVVLGHKYSDRHLHRCRQRSRKPVEPTKVTSSHESNTPFNSSKPIGVSSTIADPSRLRVRRMIERKQFLELQMGSNRPDALDKLPTSLFMWTLLKFCSQQRMLCFAWEIDLKLYCNLLSY